MTKTLIIHPDDDSTSFLEVVYRKIPNKTIVKGGVNQIQLQRLIESHDRVMMMGHGTEDGLLSVGQFFIEKWLVINDSSVPFLKTKMNNVFIWCHSDGFVNSHQLNGFYTGMFISEVGEAITCGFTRSASQAIVDESNQAFCEIMSNHIMEDTGTLHKKVFMDYCRLAMKNPIALYNHQRLYAR